MKIIKALPNILNVIVGASHTIRGRATQIGNRLLRSPKNGDSFINSKPALIKIVSVDNETMSVEKVSSDSDLREIYGMNKEAFLDVIPKFFPFYRFKKLIAQMDTYAVKVGDDIVGGFQAQLLKNQKLYIAGMVLKKELRIRPRKSLYFLGLMKDAVTKLVKEHDAKTVFIHVSSKNNNLIDLYRRIGFKITDEKDLRVSFTKRYSVCVMEAKINPDTNDFERTKLQYRFGGKR